MSKVSLTARPVGVEDTGDPNVNAILPLEAIGQGLSDPLALVVASTGPDRVDMTPTSVRPELVPMAQLNNAIIGDVLVLRLGVNLWVTVNLGSGGDKEARLCALSQTKHVQSPHERCLDGLDSIELVMWRRGWTCEMIDFFKQAVS